MRLLSTGSWMPCASSFPRQPLLWQKCVPVPATRQGPPSSRSPRIILHPITDENIRSAQPRLAPHRSQNLISRCAKHHCRRLRSRNLLTEQDGQSLRDPPSRRGHVILTEQRRAVVARRFGHLRQASENPTATAVSAGKLREKWRCPGNFSPWLQIGQQLHDYGEFHRFD